METSRGRFITVEGPEGAGKSTQIRSLKEFLEQRGLQVVLTREPGGTRLGERLREILLSDSQEPVNERAELLIMFAARVQHVEQLIKPALRRGHWVLSDRFTDASFAYQGGGRQMPLQTIRELAHWTLNGFSPDLTLLFDVPVEIGMQRIRARGRLDRFETEQQEFFERVRRTYLQLAQDEPQRIQCIDAAQSLAQVTRAAEAVLQAYLDRLGMPRR